MEQAIPVVNGFQHSDRKYMCETCCCGAVHCQTGAKRVGIFMAVMMTLQVFISILGNSINSTSVFLWCIKIAITYLLFMGIREMNPRFILPYATFIFLGVFGNIVVMMFITMIMISPLTFFSLFEYYIQSLVPDAHIQADSDQAIFSIRIFCFVTLFFCSLILLINYWFFNIIKRCYTYLLDFENYRKVHASIVIDVHGVVHP